MTTFGRAGSGIGIGILLGQLAACGGTGGDTSGGAGGAANGPPASPTAGAGGGTSPNPGYQEQRSELPRDTTPPISTEDYARFIANANDFGLALFQQLVPSSTNLICSPVSTAVALGMTYAGARGNTATQMATALHSDLPAATFHAGVNQLLLELESRNVAPYAVPQGTKSLTLLPANAAWVQTGYSLAPEYLDTLGKSYNAGIKLLDFLGDPPGSTQAINQWVAEQTKDRIPELIPKDAISIETRLVLTNALYFYGSWASQFDQSTTANVTFHTLAGGDVTVPMLFDGRYIPYAEGDGYQMIELGYEGGQLSMTVLLPAAERFDEIRAGLTSAWLDQMRASMTTLAEVYLLLPKFRFTYGTASLVPALRALGMTDAFQPSVADFSGMEPQRQLYIADVLHQAFIAVDEDGTEAAAATAVIMNTTGIPISTKTFRADRPFLIFIRDASGALLFTGQVGDPSA
jgi:serpin B